MFNQVTLVGRVGNDPDIRATANGVNVANLRMATSERWTGKDGKKVEKTEWHNVVAFDKLADVIGKYVHKGDLFFVQGRLQTRKWQDKEGQDRYTVEVVTTDLKLMPNRDGNSSGANSEEQPPRARGRRGATSAPAAAATPAAEDEFDDDIPF